MGSLSRFFETPEFCIAIPLSGANTILVLIFYSGPTEKNTKLLKSKLKFYFQSYMSGANTCRIMISSCSSIRALVFPFGAN